MLPGEVKNFSNEKLVLFLGGSKEKHVLSPKKKAIWSLSSAWYDVIQIDDHHQYPIECFHGEGEKLK